MDIKIAHLIKDSIHGTINFSPTSWKWAQPILHSYEFQRLSRVMQLGTTFKTFPSAVHTRYNHCLGAYEMARKMLVSLSASDPSIEENQVQTVLAAAMLHDIGHGPLSHSFEGFYHGFDHEKVGIDIIMSQEGTIYKSLAAAGINPREVANLLAKKNTVHWMQAIISSQLDCDRLDYLLRDSHNTGVSYGVIDSSIIMKWIKKVGDRLVFDLESVFWIENFLISRYHMFMQVYCNDKNLKNDLLVTLIFKRLKQLSHQPDIIGCLNPYFWELYEPVVHHRLTSLDQFLKLDDYNLQGFIQSLLSVPDKTLNRLVNGYLYDIDYRLEIVNQVNDDQIFHKNNDENNFQYYSQSYKIVSYLFDQKNQIKIYNPNTDQVTNFADCSEVFASEASCPISKNMLQYTLIDKKTDKGA